jgi:response regulator NasT
MKQSLRIAFAEDEPDMREYLTKTLPLLGHQVVVAARTGRELVEQCRKSPPDLVITDIKMPDLDGIEAIAEINKEHTLPIILLTAHFDTPLIERAREEHVLAYLVKPIKEADLAPAIGMVMHRFEELQTLRQEAADLRQAMADRKLIERAKGILMRQAKIDEPEAFRRLQKLASSKRQKLVEIAKAVLTADEACENG